MTNRRDYVSKVVAYVSSDQFVFHVLKFIEADEDRIKEAFNKDNVHKDKWKQSAAALVEYIEDDSDSYLTIDVKSIQHIIKLMLYSLSRYNLATILKPGNEVPQLWISVTQDLHQVKQLLKEVQIFREIEEKEREAISNTVICTFQSDTCQEYLYRYYIDRYFSNYRFLGDGEDDEIQLKIEENKKDEIPITLHAALMMDREFLHQLYIKNREKAWVNLSPCYLVHNLNLKSYQELRMSEYNFWVDVVIERLIPILEKQGYQCRYEIQNAIINRKVLEIRLPWEYIL